MGEKLEIKIEITKSDDGEFNLSFVGCQKSIKDNRLKLMAVNFSTLFKQNLEPIFNTANEITSLQMHALNCSCCEDDDE